MKVGTEWLVDAEGCAAALLGDAVVLRQVCERLLTDLNLPVVGAGHWHQFPPPGGLTGLYLLTESHLACHTYPEHRIATFNLYCCRSRPTWPWESRLREMLQAAAVTVRAVPRGDGAFAAGKEGVW
jgi:S-adenosylmethionine decarboxylase